MRGRLPNLLSQAGIVFILKILGSALAMGSQILLARILLSEEFGIYTYVLSWAGIGALLCLVGFDTGAIRFLAAYQAKEEWALLRGFSRTSLRVVLAASCVVAAIAATTIWAIVPESSSNLRASLLAGCVLLLPQALFALQCSSIQGLGEVVRSQVFREILRPLAMIAGLALCWLQFIPSTAPMAMLLNIAIYGALGAAAFVSLRRTISSLSEDRSVRDENSYWLKTSFQLALLSGLHLVLGQTDVLMLGSLASTTEAGMYGVANRLGTLVMFGLIAVNSVVAPRISHLFAKQELDELQRLVRLAARGIFVITAVLGTFVVVLREFILGLFGADFVQAETVLCILLCGQAVNALVGSVGFIMTMSGNQRAASIVIGASALLNVALNAVFIPKWGMEGAAAATAISMATWNLSLAVLVRKKLGLRPSIF